MDDDRKVDVPAPMTGQSKAERKAAWRKRKFGGKQKLFENAPPPAADDLNDAERTDAQEEDTQDTDFWTQNAVKPDAPKAESTPQKPKRDLFKKKTTDDVVRGGDDGVAMRTLDKRNNAVDMDANLDSILQLQAKIQLHTTQQSRTKMDQATMRQILGISDKFTPKAIQIPQMFSPITWCHEPQDAPEWMPAHERNDDGVPILSKDDNQFNTFFSVCCGELGRDFYDLDGDEMDDLEADDAFQMFAELLKNTFGSANVSIEQRKYFDKDVTSPKDDDFHFSAEVVLKNGKTCKVECRLYVTDTAHAYGEDNLMLEITRSAGDGFAFKSVFSQLHTALVSSKLAQKSGDPANPDLVNMVSRIDSAKIDDADGGSNYPDLTTDDGQKIIEALHLKIQNDRISFATKAGAVSYLSYCAELERNMRAIYARDGLLKDVREQVFSKQHQSVQAGRDCAMLFMRAASIPANQNSAENLFEQVYQSIADAFLNQTNGKVVEQLIDHTGKPTAAPAKMAADGTSRQLKDADGNPVTTVEKAVVQKKILQLGYVQAAKALIAMGVKYDIPYINEDVGKTLIKISVFSKFEEVRREASALATFVAKSV